MDIREWIAGGGICEEQYAYSVDVLGTGYDVYHFHKDGKPGTLAFCRAEPSRGITEARWIIAVFSAGHLTPTECEAKILEARP